MTNNTMYYIGKIGGRVDVYINANLRFDDGYVVIGRKTNQNESRVYLTYKERDRFELANMAPPSKDLGISRRLSITSTLDLKNRFQKLTSRLVKNLSGENL